MAGHIRRAGKASWELKFNVAGKTQYRSFKGTKREAIAEMTRLTASALTGSYVDTNKITMAEFLERWQRDWVVSNVSAKTADRYAQEAQQYVIPYIGKLQLQKLKPIVVNELYGKLLREGGRNGRPLSPRSVGNAHRLLRGALKRAVEWGLVLQNPTDQVRAPRCEATEIEILDEAGIKALLDQLRGTSLYMVAVLGLATGMRRNEMLALRWQDVEGDKIKVERSLEQSKRGLRFKSTKTRAGRRMISIPAAVIAELRKYRLEQQQRWLALGLGRIGEGDLVLATWEGKVRSPTALSKDWHDRVPATKLHALRHTHASALISAGMDVVSVSRRLGHSKPSVTLNTYAHLFSHNDDRATAIMQATFVRAQGGGG
jgi:integrase